MLEAQVRALEVRRRLFNPPHGVVSSELDILSAPLMRRERIETAQAQEIRELRITIVALRAELASAHEQLRRYQTGEASEALDAPPTLGNHITVKQIVAAVSKEFQVTVAGLMSRQQIAVLVLPRKVVYLLASELLGLPLAQIGRRLGRDHTTVLCGIRSIKKLVESGDGVLKARVALVKEALGAQ